MSSLLWGMAQARMDQLDHEAKVQRLRQRGPTSHGGRAARRSGPWARVCAWAGYKMIAFGCRLARPALVAGARATISAP